MLVCGGNGEPLIISEDKYKFAFHYLECRNSLKAAVSTPDAVYIPFKRSVANGISETEPSKHGFAGTPCSLAFQQYSWCADWLTKPICNTSPPYMCLVEHRVPELFSLRFCRVRSSPLRSALLRSGRSVRLRFSTLQLFQTFPRFV